MSGAVLTAPAFLRVPARTGSLADVVVDFAALGGRVVDPEEELAIDCLTSIRADGLWAAPTGCIIEPRQNGKTGGVLTPIVLSELYDEDYPDRIVWTAHRFKTARDAFLDCCGLIGNSEELSARVKHISYSHGEEGIYLTNGAALEFLARSSMGGRGLGGKVVVLDEGMALASGMLGALIPTLSARRNPLVLVGSSACLADSIELFELVKAGREGSDPALAYVEWCAPGGFDAPGCQVAGCLHVRGTVGCVLDDPERWRAGNPGMLRGRLTERFIKHVERRRLSPLEFARERLGWHETPVDPNTPPVRVEDWLAQTDPVSEPVGPVVFSVEVPPSRACATVAVGGRRPDGGTHVGVVDRRYGTDWLLERVVELVGDHEVLTVPRGSGARVVYCSGVVIDPVSPAVTLVEPLRQRGIEPVLMTTREVGTACAQLQDGLTQATIWHRDAPDVDVALEGAAKRSIGEGMWAFGRRKSADAGVEVDPAVAVANAAWCVSLVEEYDLTTSVW